MLPCICPFSSQTQIHNWFGCSNCLPYNPFAWTD
jgi:hypothetical protein